MKGVSIAASRVYDCRVHPRSRHPPKESAMLRAPQLFVRIAGCSALVALLLTAPGPVTAGQTVVVPRQGPGWTPPGPPGGGKDVNTGLPQGEGSGPRLSPATTPPGPAPFINTGGARDGGSTASAGSGASTEQRSEGETDKANDRQQIADAIHRLALDSRQHASIVDKVGRMPR
jgi:hypothetical protein